jgi:hypothetical protein
LSFLARWGSCASTFFLLSILLTPICDRAFDGKRKQRRS